MTKETRMINGNEIIIIWGNWENAGENEKQRFIERMIINGVDVVVADADSSGQVKYSNGVNLNIYYDGEPMESNLDPVDVAFKNVTALNFRPCALCGKLGEIVMTENDGWYRLEILCPDKCDECGTGEDNILFASQHIHDLDKYADENEIDIASIRWI
jgi:hypothetical protein